MNMDTCVSAVIYNPATGRITGNGTGFFRDFVNDSVAFVVGVGDKDTDYVDRSGKWPTIRPRPAMPITQNKQTILADGGDFVVFEGVPVGAEVNVRDTRHIMGGDGTFEFATLMPGEYEITFSKWPYLDHRAAVTAR